MIFKVFRSIDSNSVKGFPENPRDGTQFVRKIDSLSAFALLYNLFLSIIFDKRVFVVFICFNRIYYVGKMYS